MITFGASVKYYQSEIIRKSSLYLIFHLILPRMHVNFLTHLTIGLSLKYRTIASILRIVTSTICLAI